MSSFARIVFGYPNGGLNGLPATTVDQVIMQMILSSGGPAHFQPAMTQALRSMFPVLYMGDNHNDYDDDDEFEDEEDDYNYGNHMEDDDVMAGLGGFGMHRCGCDHCCELCSDEDDADEEVCPLCGMNAFDGFCFSCGSTNQSQFRVVPGLVLFLHSFRSLCRKLTFGVSGLFALAQQIAVEKVAKKTPSTLYLVMTRTRLLV